MAEKIHDPIAQIIDILLDPANRPAMGSAEDDRAAEEAAEQAVAEAVAEVCEQVCRMCAVENKVKVSHEWTHIGICPLCQERHILFDVIRDTVGTAT